jgi:hypothetical protein
LQLGLAPRLVMPPRPDAHAFGPRCPAYPWHGGADDDLPAAQKERCRDAGDAELRGVAHAKRTPINAFAGPHGVRPLGDGKSH